MNDYLEQCLDDINGPGGERNYKAFQETFCARCHNPDCRNAKWAKDKFTARVSTQVERFFNPQNRADQRIPRYAQIQDFVNMAREAIRLAESDRRGDWTVPGEPSPIPTQPDPVETAVANSNLNPPPQVPLPSPPLPSPQGPLPQRGNTPVREGIMIGGGPAPAVTFTAVPKVPAGDPWAVSPVIRVIQPGATVQMGGAEDKETPDGIP